MHLILRITLVALALLTLTACSLFPLQPVEALSPLDVETSEPSSITLSSPSQANRTAAQPTPTDVAVSSIEQINGNLRVRLFTQEEAVVQQDRFTLVGEAPIETIVSVNDEIIVVGKEESFSIELGLEEGVNLIEVVASNLIGDQVAFQLVVTYEPTP